MSDASKAKRTSPVTRAERLLDRFGRQLSASRAQVAARMQNPGNGHANRPAVERAEELLDRTGTQIGQFAARASYDVRRLMARAREEAEDWWIEAQQARQNGHVQAGARAASEDSATAE